MKERPILFSAEMVRAILDGRKTQTRRVVKPQPELSVFGQSFALLPDDTNSEDEIPDTHWRIMDGCNVGEYGSPPWEGDMVWHAACPYGLPGDRLWVRETWGLSGLNRAEYKTAPADFEDFRSVSRWIPSIHMPRWASRITLEITGIRVERVQDISERDAMYEGVSAVFEHDHSYNGCSKELRSAKAGFMFLWDSINAKRGFGWEANPWVWVVEFKRV